MLLLVEPLKKVIIDNRAYSGEQQNGNYFGGFCTCGGIMRQRIWVETDSSSILISECDDCWKNIALIFNSKKFAGKKEVKTLGKREFGEFLKEILSPSEVESILNKARGERYNPSSLSRAKKKLARMNLGLEEVLKVIA
jgi:hypothetical protein